MALTVKSAAVISLRQLETKVKVMVRQLPPESITKITAPSMKAEVKKISAAKDEFRKAVRAFLIKFGLKISEEEKLHTQRRLDSRCLPFCQRRVIRDEALSS